MASSLFPMRGAPRSIAQLTQPKTLMGPVRDAMEQKGLAMTTPVQLFFGLTEDATLAGQIRGMQAYVGMWLAYSCMKFRATKLVEAPLTIVVKGKDGETALEGDHPLARLLEQPNPDMDMAELLELVSLYLDHGGRALLVKNRDRGKRVGSMYAFSRDEFIVRPANGQMYGSFEVSTQAGFKVYGPEDVVFFQEADPRLIRTGIGPLDVALSHINIGEEMRKAVSAALKNAIRPGSTITVPQALSDPDFKRMKEEWQSTHGGVINAGKNVLLDNGAKLELVDRALKDLELGPVQGDIEAAICAVFEVHPSLIGTKLAMENSSGLSDTIKPATELFYDRVCFPRWGKLERTLTRSLLREIDGDLSHVMRFDRSGIRELQDDMTARTKEAQQAAQFWTVDEQRAHTKKKPLGGEKGGKLGIEARPAPAAAPGQQPPKDKAPPKKAHPRLLSTKTGTIDQRAEAWAAFDTKATEQEPAYARIARTLFAIERSGVARLFDVKASDDEVIARALRLITALYGPNGDYHRAWLTAYTGLIGETVEIAGQDLASSLGLAFAVTNPRVQAAIELRAASLVTHVTETTRAKLHDVIAQAIADKVGVAGMAKRIEDEAFGDDFTSARAKTIAQTETVGAMNAGELAAAQESGVLRTKEWLTQGDSRVRDSHKSLDEQQRALDEPFSNGLQYPGEPGAPAREVVNCRCTLLFSDEEPSA